jgi:hypothetical protein
MSGAHARWNLRVVQRANVSWWDFDYFVPDYVILGLFRAALSLLSPNNRDVFLSRLCPVYREFWPRYGHGHRIQI